jgi:hypothetical protein
MCSDNGLSARQIEGVIAYSEGDEEAIEGTLQYRRQFLKYIVYGYGRDLCFEFLVGPFWVQNVQYFYKLAREFVFWRDYPVPLRTRDALLLAQSRTLILDFRVCDNVIFEFPSDATVDPRQVRNVILCEARDKGG